MKNILLLLLTVSSKKLAKFSLVNDGDVEPRTAGNQDDIPDVPGAELDLSDFVHQPQLDLFGQSLVASSSFNMKWNYKPEELNQIAKDTIQKHNSSVFAVLAVKGPRTFENTIVPVLKADYDFDNFKNPLQFLKSVTPNKQLKKAISEAESLLEDYDQKQTHNDEFYQIYKSIDMKNADKESQKYMSKIISDAKRGGIELPKEKKDKL